MPASTKDPTTDKSDEVDQADEKSGPREFKNADGKTFRILEDGEGDEGQPQFLREGARVLVVSGPGTEDGTHHRMASVQEVYYEDNDEALKADQPGHPGRRFARVVAYDVLTRDSRSEILHVTPENVRELSITDGWGRGSV